MSQRLLVKAKSLIFYTLKGHREFGENVWELLKGMGRMILWGTDWVLNCISLEESSSQQKHLKPWWSSPRHCLRDETALTTCYQWVLDARDFQTYQFQGKFLILSALFLFHKPPIAELYNFPIVQSWKNNIGKYKDFLNVDSEMEGQERKLYLGKSGFWSWIWPCQVAWPWRFCSMSLDLNGLKEGNSQ